MLTRWRRVEWRSCRSGATRCCSLWMYAHALSTIIGVPVPAKLSHGVGPGQWCARACVCTVWTPAPLSTLSLRKLPNHMQTNQNDKARRKNQCALTGFDCWYLGTSWVFARLNEYRCEERRAACIPIYFSKEAVTWLGSLSHPRQFIRRWSSACLCVTRTSRCVCVLTTI